MGSVEGHVTIGGGQNVSMMWGEFDDNEGRDTYVSMGEGVG